MKNENNASENCAGNSCNTLRVCTSRHILSLIIIVIIILVLFTFFSDKIKHFNYKYIITPHEISLSQQDNLSLQKLIQEGKIISVRDVYKDTLDYYNILIAVLIGAFTVSSILAYFNIKATTKDNLEKEVANNIKDYMNRHEFYTIVETMTQENTSEPINTMNDTIKTLKDISERNETNIKQYKDIIEGLHLRIDELEKKIEEKLNGKN